MALPVDQPACAAGTSTQLVSDGIILSLTPEPGGAGHAAEQLLHGPAAASWNGAHARPAAAGHAACAHACAHGRVPVPPSLRAWRPHAVRS